MEGLPLEVKPSGLLLQDLDTQNVYVPNVDLLFTSF